MSSLHDFIEIASLLLMIIGAVAAWVMARGRRFGLTDVLVFMPLAAAADFGCYQLYLAVAGGHSESAAYGALAALLVLLGVAPVAAGLTLVATLALLVSLARHSGLRYAGLFLLVVAAFINFRLAGHDDPQAPAGSQNDDRLAGESWALENGIGTHADCDRQSPGRLFRQGCYAIADRFGGTR